MNLWQLLDPHRTFYRKSARRRYWRAVFSTLYLIPSISFLPTTYGSLVHGGRQRLQVSRCRFADITT